MPNDSEVFDMYRQMCDGMVTTIDDVTRLVYLSSLRVFPKKPNALKVRETTLQDHRYIGWTTDTTHLFEDDFRKAHAMAKDYEHYRDWYIFVEDVWPEEYRRWQVCCGNAPAPPRNLLE